MTGERDEALGQARARLQEAQEKLRVEGEVSVEERYTGELVAAEEREAGMEDQIRMVSNNSTEASEEDSQVSMQVFGSCFCSRFELQV